MLQKETGSVNSSQKTKAAISFLLAAVFFCSFTVKTFHHLDAHASAENCEAEENGHLHDDIGAEECFICDFFFSPVSQTVCFLNPQLHFFSAEQFTPSIKLNLILVFHFNYSLRGPPVSFS